MSDKNKYFEPKMHKQALQAECCRLHDQRDLARRDYECMNKFREHAEKHRNQLRQALELLLDDALFTNPAVIEQARAALKATEE